ncbi:MAG: C_GCAxxG_C_C family protein [Clostridia bacterium]|nr:C_GCAxxG_C_C family protein [Clostridia bacterium]
MTRGELAKRNFLSGYNCSQAVVLAFSDLTGFDKESLALLSQPFGTGMGGMREVCGTVSGMWFVLGAIFGDPNPGNPQKRNELYKRVRELADKFEQDNGSIVCRELLGLVPPGTRKGLITDKAIKREKRPCPELCEYAANILDEYIKEHRKDLLKTESIA